MTTRIPPKEWEALSAYLDNELTSKERISFEARLSANSELRSMLEGLRQTRAVLRSQPRLRARRNFTLTPQMAGARPGGRPLSPGRSLSASYPPLRLSSILATIFFFVVLAGDLLAGALQPPGVPITQVQALQVAPSWPGNMGGMGGGGAAPEVPPSADNGQPAEKAVQVETVVEPTLAAGQVSTETVRVYGVEVTPLAALGESPTPSPESVLAFSEAEPEKVQPDNQGLVEAPGPQSDTPREVGELHVSFLRIVQILLAGLAIGTGLIAFFLRRSGRV